MTVPCPTCGVQVTVPVQPANYFVRHWRGELPLGVSIWVNGLLLSMLLTVATKALISMDDSFSLKVIAKLTLLLYATAIAGTVWQLVGIWRSALSYGGSSFRAMLAKIAVVIGLLHFLFLCYATYLPQSQNLVDIINGDRLLPPYEIRTLFGGTEVEFRGGIRAGCSEELEEALAAAPQAKVLRIESPGGRLAEAKKMIRLVRERDLITFTSEQCQSAAPLVLMAGRQRIVGVGARVGFHAGRLPGATAGQVKEMADLVRSTMELAGVSEQFISRVLATPPNQMWYPTFREMLAAGVVTRQSFGHAAP